MAMTRKEAIVAALSAGSFTTNALSARIEAATGESNVPTPSLRRAISELRIDGFKISFMNRHYTLEEFPGNIGTPAPAPAEATL